MKKSLVLSVFLMIVTFNLKGQEKANFSETLWYNKPAKVWTEALPLGNGRLGAMVYGNTNSEIIQFNEETLWSGQPHDYSHKNAYKYLDSLRNLLFEGKQMEAHKMGNEHVMSNPLRQLSYQPFGNITLDFQENKEVVDYKRTLDLDKGICSVNYELYGTKFSREAFSSLPDQAIVIHLKADKKGKINFNAGLNSPHSKYEISVENNVIILRGKATNYTERKSGATNFEFPESKLTFEARLKVVNEGGELLKNEKSIQVKNANNVTLILVAATSFVNYNDISGIPQKRCETYLNNLKGKSYDQLKAAHVNDYQKLFRRMKVDLGTSEISKRPTDIRLASFEKDNDPSLVALLFQYGRYLLISSSRSGTQPANLQGIWNEELAPAWDSKYTLNINAEMNYWIAEITNLSELAEPLLQLTEDLSGTGKKIAKEHYNLEGWVAHHNTDIWRGAAPINNANHGLWPTGGAWLCQHVWWHYQFSGDTNYLKNKAYPMMKEASKFFIGYLVPHKNNPQWLVSGPSNSPELGGMVMGPTMDHQIIRNLFTNTIEAAEKLSVDTEFVQILKDKRGRIAPNKIGQHGQLQEWFEDKDDPKNDHRHVSHLWGLFPGNEIHPLITPELAEACKVTLSHRGDGGTGWSRAWKINFWARLLDGDHSFLLLKNLMVPAGLKTGSQHSAGGLYPNLFDAHPPFQIDGNFGAVAGISEMILQSQLRDEKGNFILDLLPALPTQLSYGKVSGLKARGGFELNIEWKNNTLTKVEAKSLQGEPLNLRYKGKSILKKTVVGEVFTFNMEDFK